jgi:hypothetical protein
MAGAPPWFDDLTDRSKERPPPRDDASDLEWTLYFQEGVIGRAQALAVLGKGRLRHVLERGDWQRTASGVYVAHNGPLTRGQQLWSAVLACGRGALLAGLSAACAGGLRRPPGRKIHILVPAGRRPMQPGPAAAPATRGMPVLVAHRSTALADKDTPPRALPPRTAMARSLVDAAQWAGSDDEARAIVAAGCQQRLVLPEELLEVTDRMPRAVRRPVILETIGYAASGAEALSEINFDKLCRAYGLPLPDRQVRRRDQNGRLRYLDAAWRRYRVLAEVDGGYHNDPEVQWADQVRQNDLWIGDEISLRFPAWALRRRPEQVASQLRRALVRGGWRPETRAAPRNPRADVR